MKKINFLPFFFFLSLAFQLSAFESVDQKSLDAARQWLSVVDKGDYKESWKRSALTLKMTISANLWESLMNATRKPLGTIVAREVLEQRPSKDPKGLPKGDYMVIFFSTKFSKKTDVHELITLVQESDGNWRVLTYQVQ